MVYRRFGRTNDHPSSGAHLGAGEIDYQKPYQAAGLDRSIPWYQAIGNHDQFWMGSAEVTAQLRKTYVGSHILTIGVRSLEELPVMLVDSRQPGATVLERGDVQRPF